MKKILILFCSLLLSACAVSSIPKGFTEDSLKAKATQLVEWMNDGQVDLVIGSMRSDVAAMITSEQLSEILKSKFEAVGSFEKIDTIVISDVKDPKTSELYALVIVQSLHANGKATYTLSFNTDLACVGLYLK